MEVDDTPDGVVVVEQLRRDLSEQKMQNEKLLRENKRLREKLERSGDYAEELRTQVEHLGTKISKCNLASKMTLTTEEDFQEAARKWHYPDSSEDPKKKQTEVTTTGSMSMQYVYHC